MARGKKSGAEKAKTKGSASIEAITERVLKEYIYAFNRALSSAAERLVRNEKAAGAIPAESTKLIVS